MGEKEKSTLGTNRLSRRDILLRMGSMGLWKVFDHPGIYPLLAVDTEQRNGPQPSLRSVEISVLVYLADQTHVGAGGRCPSKLGCMGHESL